MRMWNPKQGEYMLQNRYLKYTYSFKKKTSSNIWPLLLYASFPQSGSDRYNLTEEQKEMAVAQLGLLYLL